MNKEQTLYLSCECTNPDHLVQVTFFYDDDTEDYNACEMYINAQLNHYLSFWRRCIEAFKYVFGCSTKYSHWNTCLVSHAHAKELEAELQIFNAFRSEVNQRIDNRKIY